MAINVSTVILSIIILVLLWRLSKKRKVVDNDKMLSNRFMLMNLASEDFHNGGISQEVYEKLSYVFHPDFGNLWDYVPPERQFYNRQMMTLDSYFWKQYNISSDFSLPPEMIYELYKSYIIQQLSPRPD